MSEKLFERARKIGSHIQAPSLTVLLRDMIKEIERLNEVERQRDQLLAALRNALAALESYAAQEEREWGVGRDMEGLEICGDLPACIINARAAIAAAEG